jgi:hypothetical protein
MTTATSHLHNRITIIIIMERLSLGLLHIHLTMW